MYDGPQGLIDAILHIDDCDIFIGIFWKRFGTPVKDAQSGTEHEFKLAYAAWEANGHPEIMFYFSEKYYFPKTGDDLDQLRQVLKFKENFPKEGLWWAYKSKSEFMTVARQHLINYIRKQFPLAFPNTHKLEMEPPESESDSSGVADKSKSTAKGFKPKGKYPPRTNSSRKAEELFQVYQEHFSSTVGKLKIFDEEEAREVERIFVEFNLIERYRRPASNPIEAKRLDREIRRWGFPVVCDDYAFDEELQPDSDNVIQTIRSDELLRKRLQAVIVGAPGSGKTTLLRYLACKIIRENGRLPVFLELKNVTEEVFKKTKGDLAELLFLKSMAGPLYLPTPERRHLKQYFLDRLAAGEAAIFLDGLDELKGTSFFTDLCNSIREFMRSVFRHNTLIISTRPYALLTRFDELKEMEIASLNEKQIKQFLIQHYGDYPVDQRDLQIPRFRKHFRELPRVPFLLAAMVRLHRSQGNIISSRFNLYKQIVKQLAVQFDSIEDPEGSLKLHFLGQLACERFLIDDVPEQGAERGAARMIFTGELLLEKVRLYLEKLKQPGGVVPNHFAIDVKNTSFLREVGNDIYAFAHLTIQEYLAASELSKRKDCAELFCRAYFDSTLVEMEVLPMTLGMVENPDAFYTMLEQLPESLNFANLRLRTRALAYTQNISDERMGKLVNRIVEFICERNIEESPYAKAVLRSISTVSGRALDLIINRLVSLMTPNNRHKDFYPKVISALGRIGDERAVAVLRDELMNGDSALRVRSANALGKIGGRDAVRALLDASKDRLPTAVRWSAGDALRLIGDERAVRELIKAFDDASNTIRGSIAGVLGQIGGELAMEALIAALEDSNSQIRASSAAALGKIGDAYAISRLSHILLNDSYSSVRAVAAYALGEIRRSKAVPDLIEAMKDKVHYVCHSVANALGKIGDESAVPVLSRAVFSKDETLVSLATEALGKIGGDKALGHLQAALEAKESIIRYNAINALGHIGGERAIAALKQALRDEDAKARKAAAYFLQCIADKQNARLRTSQQTDEPINVRQKASDRLLAVGSRDGVARCLENLKSPDIASRWDVAEALETMHPKELVEGLVNALNYPSAFVRKKAALLIGYYSDNKRILEVLEKTTERETPDNDEHNAILLAQDQFRCKLGCLKLI